MSIEVTMRHSEVRIDSLKEYAEARMSKLQEKFPKVTSIKNMQKTQKEKPSRAERQLLRMRVKARKGTVRKQRAASAKN